MFTDQLLHDRYKIISTLANGGMTTAYLADDLQNSEHPRCVVKTLRSMSVDPSQLTMAKTLFHRGATALNKLGVHPQIPHLIDFFEEDETFYTVEEFIPGHPLSAELQPGRRFSETDVIELLLEVLPILEFVHGRNVIHRDIKPDNILRRDSDQKLVLIDFGAVREINQNQTAIGPGRAGTIIGTFGYMPTEQGQGNPRPNSDIYALGMVCIQAITGLLPSQLLQDPETGEVRWQGYITVGQDLANILTKMVRYHFKDRYASATETLRAVKTLHRKLAAPPPPDLFTDSTVDTSFSQKWSIVSRPIVLAGLTTLAVLGTAFGVRSLNPLQPPISFGGDRVLDVGVLSIGRINPQQDYAGLTQYLQRQFQAKYGPNVQVKFHFIDSADPTAMEKARQDIKAQNWELAFTTTTLVATTAVTNNYRFVARMFPDRPQVDSVLFVRQDSPIQSLNDLNANIMVALADFNSAPGFYMPVYDLYGKTLKINMGSMGQAAAKVLSGQADVGAAVLPMVRDNPKLRIIHTSRPIPMSGVYLAPKLSRREQEDVTRMLLSAPAAIQQQAHYQQGQPIDYSQFLRIVQRVEEVTSCTNWQQPRVNLFCSSVIGKLTGYTLQPETVNYSLQGEDGKTYRVVLPRAILNRDPNLASSASLNFKRVSITNVQPVIVDGVPELRITELGQLHIAS